MRKEIEDIAKYYINNKWKANADMSSLSKGLFTIYFKDSIASPDIRICYSDMDLPYGNIASLNLMWHTWSIEKVETFIEMCRKIKY